MLVHYDHSCLVPVTLSKIRTLYVFVEIKIDVDRPVNCIKWNFAKSSCLAITGTIQFVAAVHAVKKCLIEVLGCTASRVSKNKKVDALVFVTDGRFHIEAFMIANPQVSAFQFDPFLRTLVLEEYDHREMKRGSTNVLDRIVEKMEEKGLDYTVVLMSKIFLMRVELFEDSVDAWMQIACPKLSIDWEEGFKRPLLTTFEFEVTMGLVKGWWERERREQSMSLSGECGSCNCGKGADDDEDYSMDYYAQDGGEWNGSYVKKKVVSANATNCCKFSGGRNKQR